MDNNKSLSDYLMQHLYGYSRKTAFFNLILAVFVTVFLKIEHANAVKAYYWLLAMTVLVTVRFIIVCLAERSEKRIDNIKYHLAMIAILFFTSLAWGYIYVSYYVEISVFMRMFILLIMAGICAGSTVSLAASSWCFYAFILPMLVAVVLQNLTYDSTQTISVVLAITAFACFLLIVFTDNHKILLNHVGLMIKQEVLIAELKQINKKLASVSITDDLTSLSNRRHFTEHLQSDWRRAKRSTLPISLLIIDVDYFKEYNDNYGHLAGDACLKKVADIVAKQIQRKTDLTARYGGDEFAVILYDTDLVSAKRVANNIVHTLHETNIKHQYSPISDRVTLSIGISSMLPHTDEQSELLIIQADKALYQVKEHGRNGISIHAKLR